MKASATHRAIGVRGRQELRLGGRAVGLRQISLADIEMTDSGKCNRKEMIIKGTKHEEGIKDAQQEGKE
jgi:hypothetical protein